MAINIKQLSALWLYIIVYFNLVYNRCLTKYVGYSKKKHKNYSTLKQFLLKYIK